MQFIIATAIKVFQHRALSKQVEWCPIVHHAKETTQRLDNRGYAYYIIRKKMINQGTADDAFQKS